MVRFYNMSNVVRVDICTEYWNFYQKPNLFFHSRYGYHLIMIFRRPPEVLQLTFESNGMFHVDHKRNPRSCFL